MIRQQHLPVPWMTWRDVDILDAINARLLAEVKRIKMLVLDEADEMLSKGFKEQAGKQETSSIGNLVLVKLENKHALAVTRCWPPFRSMESNVCFLKSSKSSWFPLHCPMRLG